MNTRLTIAALALLMAAAAAAPAGPRPKTPPRVAATLPDRLVGVTDLPDLLAGHNRERREAGLPPLTASPKLAEAALRHARDMAERDFMSHTGSDGSTPAERVDRTGYGYRSVGENVAAGYPDPEAVLEGWMDSPPHRENILGDFGEIGLARVTAPDGRPYWAAEFARPWSGIEPAKAADRLLAAINEARKAAGKEPLTTNTILAEAARIHAVDNAARGKLNEVDRDQVTPSKRVRKLGYAYRALSLADASGRDDPEALVASWIADGDKSPLLGRFSDVGVGYATDPRGMPYWTILLGRQ
jgi:uncharacterized protein YkwD